MSHSQRYKGQLRTRDWWTGFRAGREDFMAASQTIRRELKRLQVAEVAKELAQIWRLQRATEAVQWRLWPWWDQAARMARLRRLINEGSAILRQGDVRGVRSFLQVQLQAERVYLQYGGK